MSPDIPGIPSIDLLGEQIARVLAEPTTGHGLARALRAATKEVELSHYHRATQRAFPDGPEERPTKVQIGGGSHQLDGFFNIDLVPPADFLWDVREGIPLSDGTVELLFNEHFLEHIDYPRSAKGFAAESFRVLTPGGRVITGVPDAAHVLNRYPAAPAEADETIRRWYSKRSCRDDINTYLDLVNYVFRDQDDDPNYTPHLWAYDFEKLAQLFTEAGFSTVKPWTFDATLANPKREWASVYVIATK
ncbi:class I SAM-dependent methyltransferase [Kitasatospora cineracea]